MLIILIVIAGIGFLIKYVLVPGFKRNEIYGQDMELYFWGLDRHQWGSIHLILSFCLIFLLALHIIFHWKMIVSILNQMIPRKQLQIWLTFFLVVFTLIFGVMPLFIRPEIIKTKGHHFHQNQTYNKKHQNFPLSWGLDKNQNNDADSILLKMIQTKHYQTKPSEKKKQGYKNEKALEVYSYMSLNEVAKKYRISVTELALCIHTLKEYTVERLGRLRKRYEFQMDDLRNYIKSKSKQ